MYRIDKSFQRFATCKYSKNEKPVQSGLSCTPQQALELMNKGIPISTHMANEELFFDGIDNPGDVVPMDRQRGVDINDMWQEMQNINKKFSNHLYGVRKTRKEKQMQEGGE